jgi:hypothetical protein
MVNEHPENVRAAAHIAVAINMDRIVSNPSENWVRPTSNHMLKDFSQ